MIKLCLSLDQAVKFTTILNSFKTIFCEIKTNFKHCCYRKNFQKQNLFWFFLKLFLIIAWISYIYCLLLTSSVAFIFHTERALHRATFCFTEATPILWTRNYLKEDRVTPSACTSWRESPFQHHHWYEWIQGSASVQLPGVHLQRQMPRSTRNSTTRWQRWAVHLADYKRVYHSRYLKKGTKISVY